MMGVALSGPSLWGVFALIAIGIFAIRLSFIQLYTSVDGIPPGVQRTLKFVPAAILAALVAPDVFVVDGPVVGVGSVFGVVATPRVVAALAGFLTARRTGSILATVGVGMAVLWLGRSLVG
jgi:branched-subunit amino acid transport protein